MGRLSKYAAAVAVGALLSGGAAYAIAASSGSAITVCVSHHGGTLYKAGRCAKHDNKLTWNKQGPQGNPGQQGQQGSQGSPGAAGTARAYAEVTAGGASKTPAFKSGKVSGFASVTNPQTGVYCLTPAAGIDPSTSAAVVSPLYFSGGVGLAEEAFRSEETSPCSSSQFTVVTLTTSGSVQSIDFSIIVP